MQGSSSGTLNACRAAARMSMTPACRRHPFVGIDVRTHEEYGNMARQERSLFSNFHRIVTSDSHGSIHFALKR